MENEKKVTKDVAIATEKENTAVLDAAVANEDARAVKPNYVDIEKHRQKMAVKNHVSGLSEKAFLEYLVAKAKEGGWNSPIIDEIKFRIEWLG